MTCGCTPSSAIRVATVRLTSCSRHGLIVACLSSAALDFDHPTKSLDQIRSGPVTLACASRLRRARYLGRAEREVLLETLLEAHGEMPLSSGTAGQRT